jgi:hypothetical protein
MRHRERVLPWTWREVVPFCALRFRVGFILGLPVYSRGGMPPDTTTGLPAALVLYVPCD